MIQVWHMFLQFTSEPACLPSSSQHVPPISCDLWVFSRVSEAVLWWQQESFAFPLLLWPTAKSTSLQGRTGVCNFVLLVTPLPFHPLPSSSHFFSPLNISINTPPPWPYREGCISASVVEEVAAACLQPSSCRLNSSPSLPWMKGPSFHPNRSRQSAACGTMAEDKPLLPRGMHFTSSSLEERKPHLHSLPPPPLSPCLTSDAAPSMTV